VGPSAKNKELAAGLKPVRGSRKGARGWRCLSLCLLLILLIQCPPALANSGPPRILPDQNKVIFMENPGVALVREHLRMEWKPELYSAEITVTYIFENTKESPQALTLWFMSGDYEDQSFEIRSSSEWVPSKEIEPAAYHIENWAPEEDPPFVTPFNELPETSLDYYGQIQTPARITEWLLELAPRERTEVVVAYEAISGYLSHSDYFTNYRTLYYALSPARFFDGEAVVDLELIVPDNWFAAANLPLELEAPGRYTLKNYAIGSEDLYLSLLDTKALMFGLNSRAALLAWTWPPSVFSFIAALLFARHKKRVAAGLLIVGIAVLSLNVVKPSYGMVFMMILFLPIVVVTSAFIAAVVIVCRRRRRIRERVMDIHFDDKKPKD